MTNSCQNKTARKATTTVIRKIRNNNESKQNDDEEPDISALVEFMTKDAVLWEVFLIKLREKQIVTSYGVEEFLYHYVNVNKDALIMMYDNKKAMKDEVEGDEVARGKPKRSPSVGFLQSLLNNNNNTLRRLSFRKIDLELKSDDIDHDICRNASMRRRSLRNFFHER